MESDKPGGGACRARSVVRVTLQRHPPNPYNTVYRLTPFDAYRQGLVKRIEVASVIEEDNANLPLIRIDDIITKKRTLTARVAVHKLMAMGAIKETMLTIKPEDDLEERTGRAEYQGLVVDEINWGAGFVRFTNNVEIKKGGAVGTEKAAIFEAQNRSTIEEHFQRQARLRERDIKVLSLFFIERSIIRHSRWRDPHALHQSVQRA